jgi:hypothetical protein
MLLIVRASSEEEDIVWCIKRVIAEPYCPETLNRDRLTVGGLEQAVEVKMIPFPTTRTDAAIAKVAHQ